MSRFDPYHITLTVFTQLRLQGFELGVDSLLTAYHAIDGGWGQQSILALKETLSLLWCHSLSKQSDFELIWSQLKIEEEETPPSLPAPQPPTENRAERREQKSRRPEPPQLPKPSPKRPLLSPTPIPDPEPQPQMATLGTLPVQAPFMPANVGDSTEDIGTYWPLSRREMVYGWRYLRRMSPLGPANIIDVEQTIKMASSQGFYLGPLYRRQDINLARLVMFMDQRGSMMPVHRFTRDLVETAHEESGLDIDRVSVCYFQNTPSEQVYRDPHLTVKEPLANILAQCDAETSVVIVSDCGAARGQRSLERLQALTEFVHQLQERTSLVAWLNPMPQTRWSGTSAQIMAYQVPMFELTAEGFTAAIDVLLRGPQQV